MQEEKQDNQKITPIGVTDYRSIRRMFGIKEKNRRAHIYMIGKTGTGKSTLLLNMLASDIRHGEGVGLIDPHGDLAEALLDYVPRDRIDDVIYINPAELEHSIAFNPLRKVKPELRHLVVSGLLSVFKKIWPDFWGPRLEHILRHALLTLLEYPGSTLLDVPRLLTSNAFRGRVLAYVRNRDVLAFWRDEFEKYPARLRSEAIAPVLNKIGQLLTALPLRNIVGQPESSFSVRRAMDEGKILIANLAKGRVGEDSAALLGAMLVHQMQLAAATRAQVPEGERRAFYLYVDEFPSFVTRAFADAMAEARKYGLSLVLAHQHLKQLGDEIRAAVFGNVGTMIAFRVSAEDAQYLAEEFYPTFSRADLARLPNHRVYLKMLIDGVSSRPFSAATLRAPASAPLAGYRDDVIRRSRQRYSRRTGPAVEGVTSS